MNEQCRHSAPAPTITLVSLYSGARVALYNPIPFLNTKRYGPTKGIMRMSLSSGRFQFTTGYEQYSFMDNDEYGLNIGAEELKLDSKLDKLTCGNGNAFSATTYGLDCTDVGSGAVEEVERWYLVDGSVGSSECGRVCGTRGRTCLHDCRSSLHPSYNPTPVFATNGKWSRFDGKPSNVVTEGEMVDATRVAGLVPKRGMWTRLWHSWEDMPPDSPGCPRSTGCTVKDAAKRLHEKIDWQGPTMTLVKLPGHDNKVAAFRYDSQRSDADTTGWRQSKENVLYSFDPMFEFGRSVGGYSDRKSVV